MRNTMYFIIDVDQLRARFSLLRRGSRRGRGGGAASEINNCYQRTGEEKGKRSGISGPPRALFPFFASLEVCGEESARFTHTS